MINWSTYYLNLSLENAEGEIWKDIPGYEGIFQASTMGRVKRLSYVSVRKGGVKTGLMPDKILKPTKNPKGYVALRLYINDQNFKPFTVHKLIMLTFTGTAPLGMDQVNHINGIKTDNRLVNLERSNNSHNIKHAWATGLFKPKVVNGTNSHFAKPVIHKEYGVFFTIIEAAKITGVHRMKMAHMLSGKINNPTKFQYS